MMVKPHWGEGPGMPVLNKAYSSPAGSVNIDFEGTEEMNLNTSTIVVLSSNLRDLRGWKGP